MREIIHKDNKIYKTFKEENHHNELIQIGYYYVYRLYQHKM